MVDKVAGSPRPMTWPGDPPPHVVAPLPEGSFIMRGQDDPYALFAVIGEKAVALGLPREATVSRDDSYVVVTEEAGATSSGKVVVLRPDGSHVLDLAETGALLGEVWSPASDSLSYLKDTKLVVVDVPSGERREFNIPRGIGNQSWSKNGSHLLLRKAALEGEPGRAYLLDILTSAIREIDLGDGDWETVSLSPNGKYVSYSAGGWFDGWRLKIENLDTGDTCEVTPAVPYRYETAAKPPFGADWSPDSAWVAYSDNWGKTYGYRSLHVANAATCEDRLVTDAAGAYQWSPDGRQLAIIIVSKDTSHLPLTRDVNMWSPYDGLRPLSSTGEAIEWSPDGASLLAISADGIEILEAATGQSRRIAFSEPMRSEIRWSPTARYVAALSVDNRRLYTADLEMARLSLVVDGDGEYWMTAWGR